MAHRFIIDSSPMGKGSPLTPDRRRANNFSQYEDNLTSTPLGPPSAAADFGSSVPPAFDSPRPSNFGIGTTSSTGGGLFGQSRNPNAPLGRLMRGRPSGLSRQLHADDDGKEDGFGEGFDDDDELPPLRGSLFRSGPQTTRASQRKDDMEAEVERYIDEEMEEELSADNSDTGDIFLNMRHDDRAYGQPVIGEEPDLMMLQTPAATARVRKEAESIYSQSTRFRPTRNHELQFGTIAKDIYTYQEPARITESPDLILKTENLVCQLYNDGVGAHEDPERLENSLANITYRLIQLWTEYTEELPPPEGEDLATIGPPEGADQFEKAAYVAHLILRMHHARFDTKTEDDKIPPLPEILFDWLQSSHNLFPNQVREISRYKPSPACHSLYWQTLRNALLRGDVTGAQQLLRNAGWEHVRRGPLGGPTYTGKALENVRRFAEATCEMLDQCPAARNDWEILDSSWTLFRVQARGSLDRLTLFAEGKDTSLLDSLNDGVDTSMSAMAKKASSQIPWDIYENLQTIYDIVLGQTEAILETAQDWCEATVALFGWWDESVQRPKSLVQSQFGVSPGSFTDSEDYFDRLVTVFNIVIQSGLTPNTMNPVEVALASAFEACSVAEIASLGKWLPPQESAKPLPADSLDIDDLMLLGVGQPSTDDIEGIKDTTLVIYARELAGIEHLSPQRDGWEMAIQVLGHKNSSITVNKMWRLLSDLGMMNYAEETAETFAEILSKESHRYGEALWYFALSHRTDRVREVLNLLMSYSLVQSTVYPAEKDLDEDLKGLLRNRSETLEEKAKIDLEAAQLLGRMLSGYATLRKFYEIRDEIGKIEEVSPSRALAMKKQAAFALVAVVSSSGDNIRGGLYDETRDAVVSEDFLLALLGETTVFINQSPSVISLEQLDILLKAIEDIQAVGTRVYSTCEEFFNLVLASAQGLKGSTPADLMKSTSSLSDSTYMMSGSSLLASHMQKSIMGGGGKVNRGWDWRKGWLANTKGEDVIRKLSSLPPAGLQSDTAHCQSQNFHPTKKFVRGNESRAHKMAPIELAGRSGGAMTSLLRRAGSSSAAGALSRTLCASSTRRFSSVKSLPPTYERLFNRYTEVRRVLGKQRLTLAEKILYSHLDNVEESLLTNTDNGRSIRGKANLLLKPDRVNMQDASAQMALLQFMSCNLEKPAIPASIHCDHLIVGAKGAENDLSTGIQANKEIFDFLESAARKYGMDFWPPGAGIIHQTVLENYALPGLMMLGTDSHSPNAGGLCTVTIGVGGADAVEALVGAPWELKAPKVLGVQLTGSLNNWVAPKDVILKLAGELTVRGGTGSIIEYFGPGVDTLSATGMATICNMGAEVGATTSIFPYTEASARYLESTRRSQAVETIKALQSFPGNNASEDSRFQFKADEGAEYDQLITINLSELEPHVNGPFTPDLATPLSKFKDAVKEQQWPEKLSAGLIGSCTNSSYEDMTRVESLLKEAADAGLKPAADFYITPGSEQIRATLERDGTLKTFEAAGGVLLSNACGPCIGQWQRQDGVTKGTSNAILTSYNRNFRGRNDGNPETMNFLASPEIVTAMAFAGSTTFNPMTDTIKTPSGKDFKFSPPHGLEGPKTPFEAGVPSLGVLSQQPDPSVQVAVSPSSDRLAFLEPFAPFPESDLSGLRVLVKVTGKCTTDTISAAGPWLKYKGHLPNISTNTLNTATNAETGEVNAAYDLDGSKHTIPELGQLWKERNQEWLVVAEHNYGEGSAREHAALQPRYLGARVVLTKSFARIHETNLKKQGVVPLTFENEADYDKIGAGDEVSTVGLYEMLRNKGKGDVQLKVKKASGEEFLIPTKHAVSKDQAGFILAGSALNLLSKRA
ncbi:putative aconitate hydratase, mitochondrial [Trichoderma asperellum]|uniref:Putative aconitate hydratase, mitochondrial n=1 Tax=Trichoderma asperellum TaxID=101201 RepID=A0A6V8QU77_TRIAP|nr:putative aconitate hydratase, mitochondrial [Trichoderma asperellum]